MSRFLKRPIEIEAVRYLGGNDKDGYYFAEMQPDWLYPAWCKKPQTPGSMWRNAHGLFLRTLEGVMEVSPGDWIIRGVKGELYPCKPDIFEATYDLVA